MVLVLAFSVQGIADALTLEKTLGDFKTKPAGSTFEITFSVRLDSNSTRIYNSKGQQTDEHENTIDGSGYLVFYVGSRSYRFVRTSTLTDANQQENTSPATAIASSLTGTLRAREPGDRSSTGWDDERYSVDVTSNTSIYIDGSINVVDNLGRAVYVEETRINDNGTTDVNSDDFDEYEYTRATATPVGAYSSNAPQRYAYNDEQIMITGAGTSPATVTGIEMVHQSRRYALTVGGHTLEERDQNVGIPSSITLRIKTGTAATAAGEHIVTIADSRDNDPDRSGDYPNPAPVVDNLVFKLYTTTGTGDEDDTNAITVARNDRSKSTSLTTLQIDGFYMGPDNAVIAGTTLLNYQVIEGPGTLYLGGV